MSLLTLTACCLVLTCSIIGAASGLGCHSRYAATGAVGGIAELPDAALAPLEAGSSGASGRVVAGVAAAVAAVALGGGLFAARRRA